MVVDKAILTLASDGEYSSYKSNNRDLTVLAFFLQSEIRCSRCTSALSSIESWLKKHELNLNLNLTHLEKENELILLTTDTLGSYDDLIEIDRGNFIEILKKWQKLCQEKPKEITISRDADGYIILKGNNKVVPDALLRFDRTNFRYGGSNNQKLKNLVLFLTHKFEFVGISHKFIFDSWLDDQKETILQDKSLLLEKKGDAISIFYQYQDADKEYAFVTTKEQLRRIYKQFEEIKILKPNIIRIYKDGDEIKLEGLADEI